MKAHTCTHAHTHTHTHSFHAKTFTAIAMSYVADCTAGDLQNTYSLYTSRGFFGHNARIVHSSTQAECKRDCNLDTSCLSFEFKPNEGICIIHHVSALDYTSDWKPSEGWRFFKRNCA